MMVASVLAAHTCGGLKDRLLALPAGADGIATSYAEVKQCEATSSANVLTIHVVAYAWTATERDIAGVAIRQFVHATIDATVHLIPHVTYPDDHLELELAPASPPSIAVEPVGALDAQPLNWATLAAEQLAPSAGTTAEWVAKAAVRGEGGKALRELVTKSAVVAYDARHDRTWLPPAKAPPLVSDEKITRARLLVVPSGSAWLGPFTPSKEARVRVQLERGDKLVAKALCRDDAERLLDDDRRGAIIHTEDWSIFERASELLLKVPSCTWVLALRATSDAPVVANVEAEPRSTITGALTAEARWVALDEIAVQLTREDPTVEVWVRSESMRARIHPPPRVPVAILTELGDGDELTFRALDTSVTPPATLGETHLAVGPKSVSPTTVTVGPAQVKVRIRTHRAPAADLAVSSP